MTERVLLELKDHIAHVRLNRPDKMNALDPAMFDAIIDTIAALKDRADVRVVVVSGEGRAFCAGLDLSNFTDGGAGPSNLLERHHGLANRFQQVAWGWRDLPMPVIAAAHGICFGGGLQILSGADIRFIHPDTRCAIMEMRWGLVPDMGGYPLWRGNVRDDVLRQLVYTNAEFSGAQACAWGFATQSCEEPLTAAFDLAREIADKNPDAIRGAKTLSNALYNQDDASLLMLESREQEKVMYRPNQVEAVAAQMAGRQPKFDAV